MFIIYDIDNKSLDDLIKLKFLKKINFIKHKHLQISKTGPSSSISALRNLYGMKNSFIMSDGVSPSSPVYSISSPAAAASFNYTDDEMRRFASFALDKFNQSLLASPSAAAVSQSSSLTSPTSYSILLFICIVLSLSIVVLFGFRVFTNVSNKRRQRSALNSLLSRLSQASAAKLESSTNMSASTTTTPSTLATSSIPESTTKMSSSSSSTKRSSSTSTANDRLSFKLLLKDFNSFRNKHFTIRLPKWRSIRDVAVRRQQKQEEKQQSGNKQFSESSSTSSSSSCDSSQFKEIINQNNKYMNVRIIGRFG